MIALLGSLLGFCGSWIPQIFKFLQDKSDKSHEITVLQMQIDAAKATSAEHIAEIGALGDAAQAIAVYQTYKTGIEWIDALNGTVRPILAYGFFFVYGASKYTQYVMIGNHAPLFEYLDVMWTEFDQSIFAVIISFYYGQRIASKMASK